MIWSLDGLAPTLGKDVYVAPNATVVGDVHLHDEVSIWFGAVLRGDVERLTVGASSNVQDNSVLHSDPGSPLVVGERVTVGHGCILHGCQIGDGALIGMGSTILNDARIGRNCLVGANALVTEGKVFADGMLIVGSPARAVRPLTPGELARLAESPLRYVQRGKVYQKGLVPLLRGRPYSGSGLPAPGSPPVSHPR